MASIIEHFKAIADPRREHRKEHLLIDIIFIAICAVICGADDWYEIEEYGKRKEEWLKTILELPNGIPSHDTFNRVFSVLDPQAVQRSFLNWVESAARLAEGQIISIDGKRLCNSGEKGSKAIIHMVSAWSNENNMVLAQQKVGDKSNEIKAIPLLLDMLTVKGCIITIDAMGCQKDIAEKIKSKEADYILAVKENHEFLYDDIRDAFAQTQSPQTHIQKNIGHGRIEKRTCRIITDTDWICKKQNWKGLQTLIAIESNRIFKATGETQSETRYFISSRVDGPSFFNKAIREHWGIENKLHWMLDVAFNEDDSTKRAGAAAENFSFISKVALNLLNKYDDFKGKRKVSTKIKRKTAGWDNDYLKAILINQL